MRSENKMEGYVWKGSKQKNNFYKSFRNKNNRIILVLYLDRID